MGSRELMALAALAATFWAYSHWRDGLRVVMVLLVLEGAIRKWLLPGAQDIVYFAKDLLLLGVYVGFWRERPRLRRRLLVPQALVVALVAAMAVGVLQIFNPALPNLLVGLLGFKAYFFYLPLLWVVPAAYPSDAALARDLPRYILLSIPVALLGAIQFMSAPDSALNAYARGGEIAGGATTFGSSGEVRVTGTFSYISGYSSYLLASMILILARLAATRWRFQTNVATYAALMLALLGMLMTGSRGPVYTLAILIPLYGWLGVAREARSNIVLGRVLLGLGLVAAALNYVGSDAIEAFYGRASGNSDVPDRVLSPVLQPARAFEKGGLLGFGIGATHQTAEAATRGVEPYSWLRGALFEDEAGRVMLELGPLGFALVYYIRVFLLVFALGQVFRLGSPLRRAIATSCVLFFLAHLPGSVVFNVTADVFFWFFGGLLLLVVTLDREAAEAARAAPSVAGPGAPAPREARLAETALPRGFRPGALRRR